jgi:hypothetical protein
MRQSSRTSHDQPEWLSLHDQEWLRFPDRYQVTEIAAIALQLQRLQKEKPILLPIDQLREMFNQRKVVVSGAVLRMVEAGMLKVVDGKYHTGKAREFVFSGVEHEHYALMAVADGG